MKAQINQVGTEKKSSAALNNTSLKMQENKTELNKMQKSPELEAWENKKLVIEQEKADKLNERFIKERPNFKYITKEKKVRGQWESKLVTETKCLMEDVTEQQKASLKSVTKFAATGASNSFYANHLLYLATTACFASHGNKSRKPEDYNNIENAVLGALTALNPQDEIEGMLCSRLVVLHDQYMHYLISGKNLAYPDHGSFETADYFMNRATKLMRLYNETLEALNRHRRKGKQEVTVTHNHVNVNDGGKAIVSSQINQQPGGGS